MKTYFICALIILAIGIVVGGFFVVRNYVLKHKDRISISSSADEVEFSKLDWCWGGLKAGNSQLTPGRIANLNVSASKLTYKTTVSWWKELQCPSRENPTAVACLFVKQDGRWKGGKFEWISESRATREFGNITSGYNGWDRQAVAKGKEFAFVIVSGNGRLRTNVIKFSR